MKSISIFGSGSVERNSEAWHIAFETGFALAEAGFVVVNGGYGGTMAATAEGAKKAGGKTIGVTTDQFVGSKCNSFIDEEIRTPSWKERLHKLVELGDGFIVLDGGTGTLVELFVVWEMLSKKMHQKPVVILGKSQHRLVEFLKNNSECTFPPNLNLSETPRSAVQYLKDYCV